MRVPPVRHLQRGGQAVLEGTRARPPSGAPNGIDVNRELGPLSPSPHEKEIAFDGGIPWKYVTRVWKKDEYGEVDFNHDEPIWER
ncbi:scabin-related ADP-ribosyltransferase [Streptomyces sp. NPDC055055]